MKTYSPLCLGGVLLIGPGVFVQAGVSDWQAAAASQSNLMHHYSFDGSTDQERMNDKKGAAHLAAQILRRARWDGRRWLMM